MEVGRLLALRKGFHERPVCPLTPAVWLVVAFNSTYPFLSIELGVGLAVFYSCLCAWFWYDEAARMWGSTGMGLWECATTFAVAWCSIYFVRGLDSMPLALFGALFGGSVASHALLYCLYKRRVMHLAKYSNVESTSQRDEDRPPSV